MTIPRRRPRYYKGQWRDLAGMARGFGYASSESVRLFEKEFASYIGTENAVATCSGRNAMELILDAMGIKQGDEVIISAYTLKDLAAMMMEKGIAPVLVDVDPETFNIDPGKIEEKITSLTKAIIATHIFGVPCEIDRIVEIAKRHGLKVIEDAAHAMGATYLGKKAGSFGDAAFFSMETIKLLNTFGGGMVVSRDHDLAAKVRKAVTGYLPNGHAVTKKICLALVEDVLLRGPVFTALMWLLASKNKAFVRFYWSFRNRTRVGRSRYSSLQGVMGLEQMKILDIKNEQRARIAALMEKGFRESVVPQKVPDKARRVQYFNVVRIDSPDAIEDVRRRMLFRGVDCGIREEITDDCSLFLGKKGECPVASEIFERNLQLPMFDGLKERDIRRILRTLEEVIP